jgi:serine protease Do
MKKNTTSLKCAGIAAASLAALALAAPTAASAAPQNSTAGALSAKTDPAVVLVESDITATIRVPQPSINQAAIDQLTSIVLGEIATGQVGSDNTSVTTELLRLIEKHPDRYFSSGSIDSIPSRLSAYGTGFIVTPDGYLVTAAHVIKPDQKEIQAQFAEFGLQKEAQKVAASNRELFDQLNAQQVKSFTETILGWQSRHMKLVGQKTTLVAQLGIAVAGFDKSAKGVPVTVIGKGDAYPGRDVAVLKLGGNTTAYPTIAVGSDADVNQGDTVYVDGYPAASTFFAATSADSQLQPTTTSGQITAIKTTDQGTAILQSQAPITPGNSGGPVLNSGGQVVGLVSAAAVDGATGTQAQGQNFFIAASVIRDMLNEHNIKPAMSSTSLKYNQAVDNYEKQYYKSALQAFQQAQNLYPGHPYAGHFISESQAAITAGKDKTPKPFPWVVAVGAGAGLVLVIGLGTWLLLRRKATRRQAPVAAWANMYGPGSPMDWQAQPTANHWATAPSAGEPTGKHWATEPSAPQPTGNHWVTVPSNGQPTGHHAQPVAEQWTAPSPFPNQGQQ